MLFVFSAANADINTSTEVNLKNTKAETNATSPWHGVYRPDLSAADIPEEMKEAMKDRVPAFRFKADSVEILVGNEIKITTTYKMESQQAVFDIQNHIAHAEFKDDFKYFTLKEGDGTKFFRQ